MSHQVVLLAVTLMTVCVCVQYTESCMCAMQHPQQRFCQADFVIKAKVKNMKQIFAKRLTDDEEVTIREPFENRYSIRMKSVYKGEELLVNVTTNHLYTAAYDSMCGVKLVLGEEYVLTGKVQNNKMRVSSCEFVEPWKSLPKWQRRGVTDRYGHNCDCQIKVCYSDNCYHKNRVEGREDICILEIQRDRHTCSINHSFCKRKEGDECGWAHTSQWRDCHRGGQKKVFTEP